MTCAPLIRLHLAQLKQRKRFGTTDCRFRRSSCAVHMRSSACGRAECSWLRLAMLCADVRFSPSVLVSTLILVAKSVSMVTNPEIPLHLTRRIRACRRSLRIRHQYQHCRHRRRGTVRTNLPRLGGARYQWLSVSLSTFVALVAPLQGLVGLTSGSSILAALALCPARAAAFTGAPRADG